jgi:hypothetical protein
MGMFDYIRSEALLPEHSEVTDELFQTKSFDRYMETYVIAATGELYKEVWKYDWVEDKDYLFGGYLHPTEGTYRREYLTNYHGDIIFYGSHPTQKEPRIWRDYYARFTEGRLTRMWYEDKHY